MSQPQPSARRLVLPTIELSYLDYGAPFHGAPPLLVFHGHTDHAWAWHDVSSALAPHHHVRAFDLRGHGDSGRGAYSVIHFVADIAGIVSALELDRPTIVAHSLGGQAVAQYAGLFPEVPRALVLIESLGPPLRRSVDERSPEGRLAVGRERAMLIGSPTHSRVMPDVADAARRLARGNPSLDGDRLDFVARHAVREVDGGVAWKWDPLTRDWLSDHDRSVAEERWAAVTCPTLLLIGADSWNRFWKTHMPPESVADMGGGFPDGEIERRAGLFANARLEYVDDCGHMVHFDQPEELIERALRFLAAVGQ